MNTKVLDIFRDWKEQGLLSAHSGPNNTITNIAAVAQGGPGDLVFVENSSFIPDVLKNNPACIVTTEKLVGKFSEMENLDILIAANVGLAQALMRQKYVDRNLYQTEWPTIHPSAIIHETAILGTGTTVGPGVVIGANVTTGNNCVIMAGSVIEHDVKIGTKTIIHPNVTLGYACVLGDEVIVHASSVIGSEGFGFAQDSKGKSHRIPQLGNVVIEDRVRIGSCTCVDRAAYNETRIGAGTKLDNLCHVAHNVTIGEDCLCTALFIIGGSSTMGNRVMTSGATGVSDHVNITDDVIFVHRSGVVKDVPQPGIYAGLPLQPMAEYTKNAAAYKKLNEMRQQLRNLAKQVASLSSPGNKG